MPARPRRFTVQWSVVGGMIALYALLALLLVGASVSPLIGIGGVLMAGGLAALFTFGLARTGAALMVITLFLAPMNDLRLGESYVTFSDVTLLLAIGALAPPVITRTLQLPAAFAFGALTVFVMGIVSSVASEMPAVSINQLARLAITAFSLPVLYAIWRPQRPTLIAMACAYVFGNAFSVAAGIVRGPVAEADGVFRHVGLTYHPNYLGLACLMAIALMPWLWPQLSPAWRFFVGGAALVSAYGIWISGSRAALLALGLLVVVVFAIERSLAGMWVLAMGFVGMLAFSSRIVSDSGNNALGRLLGAGTSSGSDQERTTIMRDAWDHFSAHPLLGVGFDGGIGAHNIYLQVAVGLGIFGLFGYLLVLYSLIRPVLSSGLDHRLSYPAIAYAVIGPVTNTLWERLIWVVVALPFAAYALRAADDNDVDEVEPIALDTPTRGTQ